MTENSSLDGAASPALLFDADAIGRNFALMLRIVGGDPDKLRPHIKTHKCREILEQQRELGIVRVKAATIAEAEISALAGMTDVLVSYPLVGPNVTRLLRLAETYPQTNFSALVDSAEGLEAFAEAVSEEPRPKPLDLFVDLDCGMHRTGAAPDTALALAKALAGRPGLRFAGIHAYDGHIHDAPVEARRVQFEEAMAIVDATLARIETEVGPVPLLVAGGSPTFAMHAARAGNDSRPRQCSPGTTVLWDCGYGNNYPDLPFEPAAFLLTRVVSHPGEGRICLDLGHKAVAAENPIDRRVQLPAIPEARFLSQSEEHLVVGVDDPSLWPVGTALVGVPKHVCPTVALHQEALVVRDGRLSGEAWRIEARDRRITV
jgi:D-serine deaminase-like pyridoxal phosphate-dependent protein